MRTAFVGLLALFCLVAVTGAMIRPITMQRDSIEIQFHLRSAKHSEAEVDALFHNIATPGHPLFRKHLSQTELVELVGASAADVNAVTDYLQKNGASAIKLLGTNDIVIGHVTVQSNLAAFGLQKADFLTAQGFKKIIDSSVPHQNINLYSIIAYAADSATHSKVQVAKKKQMTVAGTKVGDQFPGMTQTPELILNRYNAPTTPANADADFTSGVAEFQQSVFQQSDITTFSNFYNLSVPKVLVKGPNVHDSPDNTEGTLDLEYITAISGGVNTWWIAQNGTNPDPMGLDFSYWCDEVLSIPTPPSVVSISWGMGTYHYALDTAVLEADNRAFRKLGMRGITVFAASGDSGPGARSYLTCKKFMPGWPASSPYLTSVGATYANSATSEEVSVSFSGGGFSDNFATPPYQAEAVRKYLSSGNPELPKTSFFNTTGRGYPDVSALGTNFNIYYPSSPGGASIWNPVSGTSCASPTFAAIITRINLERKQEGKPAVGWLNPTIYKLGKVGYDVVSGQSIDTDCFGIFKIKGFPAAKGWDAVSGLGTPDYTFLKANL